MAGCCDPRGCNDIFGKRFSRLRASRYRKRGLDSTAQRMVDFLLSRGVQGATVLEIGGGIGEIQVELLRHGAARATNLELVDAYDLDADALLAEAGLTGRVERRQVDIAMAPDEVEAADIVVLNRVVCCYPDYEKLLGAAADHARRMLVFSHPPRNLGSRAVVAGQNALFGLTGKEFRTFAHPPEAMLDVLRARGMTLATTYRPMIWQADCLERVA